MAVQLPWTATQLISDVDAIFARAEAQADIEVQSDYARYLVIRLSGLVEQVVTEVVLAHVNAQGSRTVLSHTTWRMKGFQNPNVERLLDLVGSFSRPWKESLKDAIPESEREALGSVRAQRNRVAHGEQSTVSLIQVKNYFGEIRSMLKRVAEPF